MPDEGIPFGELEFDNEGIAGVRCPTCGKLIPADDPARAADLYTAHYLEVHGVPSGHGSDN